MENKDITKIFLITKGSGEQVFALTEEELVKKAREIIDKGEKVTATGKIYRA